MGGRERMNSTIGSYDGPTVAGSGFATGPLADSTSPSAVDAWKQALADAGLNSGEAGDNGWSGVAAFTPSVFAPAADGVLYAPWWTGCDAAAVHGSVGQNAPHEIGTAHPVTVPAHAGDGERQILDRAYPIMAAQAGLSPAAAQEFVRRASGLDDGHVHGPSNDPRRSGPALTLQQVREQSASGRVEAAPTAAQAGLLHVLQARDAGASGDVPSGAAAGLPFTPGTSPGAPGNAAVTPDVAAALLRNMTEGQPPWRPDLGRGGVGWFVTGGDPYTGVSPEKSVTVPVEITDPTGRPPLRFGEAQLFEIYEAKLADARALAESQVRAKYDRTNGEPLNKEMRAEIARNARRVAESEMWTEVGRRVAASESGVGQVELKSSTFSRRADGEFTLTSRPEAVRIQGGAPALLDIIKEHAAPAEPGVLEAAQKLAESERWAGRVQGAFRVGGKVLIVVGAAADAYEIYTATDKAKAVTEVAGGWAGATATGGAFAAWFAPADVAGPWAWAAHGVGTLAAGAAGYWAGSHVTRMIYELTVEGEPLTVGP